MILKDIQKRVGFKFKFQMDIYHNLDLLFMVIGMENGFRDSNTSKICFVGINGEYEGQYFSYELDSLRAYEKIVAIDVLETDKSSKTDFFSNNSFEG